MFAARIIAHRGGAAYAPENTLTAVREAARRGATWVELDVSLLGDGTPVIFHDKSVERTTNGKGALRELTWAEMSRLDAGAWFSAEFTGEPVPHLDDMLALIKALELGLNLELKTHENEAAELAAAVTPSLTKAQLPREKLLVSSFDHAALADFRRVNPSTAIAVLYGAIKPDWLKTARALNVIAINASYRKLTPTLARAISEAGFEIYVYTVNDPRSVDQQWLWGIDGVFTDDPDAFSCPPAMP